MAFDAEFPEKLQCLFEPKRYKTLYGGRGGAKSWGVARALLLIGKMRTTRVLCVREFQNSIQESVHKLLSDQIEALGLSAFYDIQKNVIRGRNGSEFVFEGLRNNVTRIKSFEGVDVCWVEEAQTVTKSSWEVLIPTIRKTGSEIWLTFNPNLEDDETYQRFVIRPPKNAFTVKINHSDNPWFPDVLRDEMLELKERDFDAYLNVWEGHPKQILDGAVYAKELRKSAEANRITSVPYDPTKPVNTFWDLGWADSTAIWFCQKVGFEYHIIDYIQGSQLSINEYIKLLQEKPYIYGIHYLPHDAKSKSIGTGRSIEELMRAQGLRVQIVAKLSLFDGINAARTIFENCYFDKEKCAEGLHCLRYYRYEEVPGTKMYGKNPVHDWSSHGADGFRYLAVAMKDVKKAGGLDALRKKKRESGLVPGRSRSWMGR